jgi:nucleoside phosphorylase
MNRKRPSPRFSDEPWLVLSAWAPELAELRAAGAGWGPGWPPLVLETVGVGLVEAAIGATRLIAAHRPRAVLLVGTAGVYPGHRRHLAIGAAVAVAETVLLPTAWPGSHAQLPGLVPDRQRLSPLLLRRLVRAARLATADVACPLAISASLPMARAAARRSGCALENLEAFGVARAAGAAGVPCAAILGVSNAVCPTGHLEWKRNARRAAAAACRAALRFLTTAGKTG